MSKRNTVLVGAALVALAGCAQSTEASDSAPTAAAQQDTLVRGKHAAAKAIHLSGEVTALPAVQLPVQLPSFERTTRNAEGETLKVQVPVEDAPAVEVPEGGVCGVANAAGALLSCTVGTQCVSTAAGTPAKCARIPQAPRTEG